MSISESTCKTTPREQEVFDLGYAKGKRDAEPKQASSSEKPNNWISVEDRLPEINTLVLLIHNYHSMIGDFSEYEPITVGYLHQPLDKRRKAYFYYVGVSDYGDRVRANSMCPGNENVTHWMPLPEPPQED